MNKGRKAANRSTVLAIILISAVPALAVADECKSLWIERNQIFKDQGYCFGSQLGQGYFGNAGCTTKSPTLSDSQKSRVEVIKRREAQLNCAAQKKNWTVASLVNNSNESQTTTSSSSGGSGGGLIGSLLLGGLRVIENMENSSGSTGYSSPSLKYRCKFYCEGQFGFTKSSEFVVNTPYTDMMSAQDYVREQYEDTCAQYPFYGDSGGGAHVGYPSCETYY